MTRSSLKKKVHFGFQFQRVKSVMMGHHDSG